MNKERAIALAFLAFVGVSLTVIMRQTLVVRNNSNQALQGLSDVSSDLEQGLKKSISDLFDVAAESGGTVTDDMVDMIVDSFIANRASTQRSYLQWLNASSSSMFKRDLSYAAYKKEFGL